VNVREVAWAAYVVWQRSGGSPDYQPLATDQAFIARLQTGPTLADFKTLRRFLVDFKVQRVPKNLAAQYLPLWPRLKPHVQQLAGQRLERCNLNNAAIENAIKGAYDWFGLSWGGLTTRSKVLHFFNTGLFVMWDRAISKYHGRKGDSQAYLAFLRVMQGEAIEVLKDFGARGLRGHPEVWLSGQLGYKGVRPLTKLIDDYNLVTIRDGLDIDRQWPSNAPHWLARL